MKKVSIITAIVLCAAGVAAGTLGTAAVYKVMPEMVTMTEDRNISAQQAKEIAYKKAGVSAETVNGVKAGIDTEDGQLVYDIEFRAGNTKYSAEISADDGRVVSWETERR